MRLLLPLLLLAMARLEPPIAVPDEVMAPRPFIVSPPWPWAQYYFKMSPDPKAPYSPGNGVGFAYKIEVGQQDKLIWKTDGWYAYTVFLSYNGSDLVRIGNWPAGSVPSADHLAIAFYHDGVLVKSYSTADLIKDASKVEPSVSHYDFARPDSLKLVDLGGQPVVEGFQLTTVDGVEYLFGVANGSIISWKQK